METYGNRWEVVKELGEGGQGKVYLVKDSTQGGTRASQIDRRRAAIGTFSVGGTPENNSKQTDFFIQAITHLARIGLPSSSFGALKVLHTPRDPVGFEKAKKRMRAEIEALKSINHPHVIKILDDKLDENWFVCEYFPKGALSNHSALFKGNTLAALSAFRQLVEAIAKFHSQNLVHRDIKPGNVFVAEDGSLVLGDLGLVYFADQTRFRISEDYENVGSRDWMPAWAYGQGLKLEEIRPTFDLFSLGKLLWAMVSGRTVLPLWYHRRDKKNRLEEMFPADGSIQWVNAILDQCIVQDENDCIQDAHSLLTIIDDCLTAVRNRGQRIEKDIQRHCTVCGFGIYKTLVDENDPVSMFGLRPERKPLPAYKVFACDHCGHVQMFHFEAGAPPSAWAKPKLT
jgi:serine/threonine protein kinase